jgi:hypothetical protein
MDPVQPSLTVVQQPPGVVLVGDTFEIRVVPETDGANCYDIALDYFVNTSTKAKSVKSGVPITFRCSCDQPMTDKAMQVQLLYKTGKVAVTTETTPLTVAVQKVKVATKNWMSPWYKDEGGREKSIDLLASLQPNQQKRSAQALCLKPTLCYATTSNGLVAVANQDILRILSGDLSLSEDGSRLVRLRIEDVSKNHQGQDFQIQLSIVDHPEIIPGLSPSITVRSKRNKRFRASLQSSGTVVSAVAKRPAAAEKKLPGLQIQKALSYVLKWSDDVASVLRVSSNPAAATFLSQYGYIREQILILQNSNADKDAASSMTSEALVPLSHFAPLPWQHEQRRSLDATNLFPVFEHPSLVSSHAHAPNFTKVSVQRSRSSEASVFHASSSSLHRNDDSGRIVELIVPELLVISGSGKGMPAFTIGGSFIGLVSKDGSVETGGTEAFSGKAYQMLRGCKESNLLSRSVHGDRLIGLALERVHWDDAVTPLRMETSKDTANAQGLSFEDEVEYVLAVYFKSKGTDECLGFPVFCANKRFLGFLCERRCQLGGYSLSPPPPTFGPIEMEEANLVLDHHDSDAILSKQTLRTMKAMLHHALVYSWRSNP